MSDSSTSKEMNEEDYKNLLSEVLAVTMATMIKTMVKNKNKTVFPLNTIKSNLVQLPDKYNVPFKEDILKMNGFLNDILTGLKAEHAIFVCKEKTKWDRNGQICFLLTDQFYLVVCSSFDVFQAAVEKAIKITENSVERTPMYEDTITGLSNYFVNLAIKTTTQMTPFDPNYVVWAFSHHLLSEYHAFTFVRTILCLDILWEMKNDKRLKHDRTNGVFRVRLAESAASQGSDSSEPEEVPQLIKNMLSLPSEKFIHKAPPRPAVQNSQTPWTSIVSGASNPAISDATTASENSAGTVPSGTTNTVAPMLEPNVAGPPGIQAPPGLKGPPGLPIHTLTAATPSVGAEGDAASTTTPSVVWTVAMIMAEKEERERVAKLNKATGSKKQTSTAAAVAAPAPVASTPLVYVSKNVEPKAEPTAAAATEKTTEGRKSKKESANVVPNLDIVERLAVPFTEIILKRLKTTEPFMCHDFRALLNDKNNLKKFNMQPFANRDQVLVVADAIRDVVRKNKTLVFDPKYVNPKNGQKIEVFWSADSQKSSESAEVVGEKPSAQKTASDKSVEKSVKIGDRSVEKSVEKSSNDKTSDKANASKKESKQDTSKSVAAKASTTNANSRADQGKASKDSTSTTTATGTTNAASGYDVYSSPMYVATTKRLARYFIDKAQEMVSAGQTYIVASILQVLRSAVDIVTTVENADKVKVTKVVSLSDLYELHAVEATRLMRDVVTVMRELDVLQFNSRDTFELGYFSMHKWGQSDTKKATKAVSVFESTNSSFATAPASTVFAAPGLAPQTAGVKTEAHQADKKVVEADSSVDGAEQSVELSAVPEILTHQQLLQQEQMTSLAAKHHFIPPKAPVGLSSPPQQGFGPHFGSPPSRPLAGPHSGHQPFQPTATGFTFGPTGGVHFDHMGPLSGPPPSGQQQQQQQQSDGNGPPLSFDEFMRIKANGMHNAPPRPMPPSLNVPHLAPHMAQNGMPNMHPMSFHQGGYQGGQQGGHQYPGQQISRHSMHRGPSGGGAGISIPAHLLHSGLAKHKPPQSFDPTSIPSGIHKMQPQHEAAAGGAPLSFQDFVQQMAMGEIGVRPHPHAVPPPQHTQHNHQLGMFQPPVPALSSPEVPFISTMGLGGMHSADGFSGMLPPPHATHPLQSKQPSFVPLPSKVLPVQPLHAGPQPESYEAFLMRTSKGGKGAVKTQEKQKITPNQLKPQYTQHAGLFSAAPSATHQPLPMMTRPDHFPPAVQSWLASGPVGVESPAIAAPPKKLSTDAPVFVPGGGFVVPTSAAATANSVTTATTTAGSSTSVPGLSNPLINLSVLQNAVKTVASTAATSSTATSTATTATTATTVVETAAVQGLSNPLINLSVLKNAVKTVASNGATTATTTTAVNTGDVSAGLSNPLINPLINSSILKNAVQTVASSMAGNSEFSLTSAATATDASATTGAVNNMASLKPQSAGSPPKTTKQSSAGAVAKKVQEEEPMLVDYLAQQLQTQQALDSRANAILSGFPSVASDGTAEVSVKRSVSDDFAAFFTTQQGPPSGSNPESAAKTDLTNTSHNSSFSSAARPQLADELWQSLDGDW